MTPVVGHFATRDGTAARLAEIRELLHRSFDGDFTDDDWANTLGGEHFVVVDDGLVVAHAAVVARVLDVDDEPLAAGYVEGVATNEERRREGLGSLVMTAVATHLRAAHHSARYEMGALSTDRPSFYARLGWERWQGPTFVRRGDERLRTPDEDDGVMVLRFGAHADIDLAAAITCQSRPGDDW